MQEKWLKLSNNLNKRHIKTFKSYIFKDGMNLFYFSNAKAFVRPLTFQSLQEGRIPDILKFADIKPVPKKSKAETVDLHRPCLPFISLKDTLIGISQKAAIDWLSQ